MPHLQARKLRYNSVMTLRSSLCYQVWLATQPHELFFRTALLALWLNDNSQASSKQGRTNRYDPLRQRHTLLTQITKATKNQHQIGYLSTYRVGAHHFKHPSFTQKGICSTWSWYIAHFINSAPSSPTLLGKTQHQPFYTKTMIPQQECSKTGKYLAKVTQHHWQQGTVLSTNRKT